MNFFPKVLPSVSPTAQRNRNSEAPASTANRPDRYDSLYHFDNGMASFSKDESANNESRGYAMYPGAEASIFDFTAERHMSYATSLFEATAHLIKGCLGAGLLIIHVGFMLAGLWTALIATLIIGMFVTNSMYMLIRSAHKLYQKLRLTRMSYPDVAEAAFATAPCFKLRKFSKVARYLVDTCLIAQMSGTCCVYEIMVARTTKIIMEYLSTTIRETDMSVRYYLLIIAGPMILISMIRKLKVLAPFSLVADIFVAFCVAATIYYSLKEDANIHDRPAWKSFHGFVKFCGICLYTLDGVAVVMPVENSLRNPQYYSIVIQFAMGTVIALVAVTGFFGYWGWGETCVSPITIHMPHDITIESDNNNQLPMIMQVMLAIMLTVTFAVNFWVTFRVTWYYIGKSFESNNREWWERVFRVIQVVLITCICLAVPYLMKLIVFLGNFVVSFTVFVFPALIESLVYHADHKKGSIRWRHIKNTVLVIFGIIFASGAFYSTIDTQLLNHPVLLL